MPKGVRPIRRSKSLHPSIAALIESNGGSGNPKEIIRNLARAKIAVAKGRRWEGPPYSPQYLCSIFGLRCFEVDHDIGGDGRIVLGRNGRPKIEYASGRMKERQRFTIFHEFAHTLFPDFCDFLPLHHGSSLPLSPEEKEFEGLCDTAASEMLFPIEDVVADLKALEHFDFPALHQLGIRYEASIDATCYRMAQAADNLALSFAFLTDQRGDFGGRGPLWVRHSSPGKLFKGYVQPGTTPPLDSVALQCFREQLTVTGAAKETWWIRGTPRTYLTQAAILPTVAHPAYPKVVVLFLPQGYKGGAICIG